MSEWRCAFCGKPHETDDPPCDECGHDQFEPAIVQKTDVDSTVVWVCTDCGREHPKHAPPCSRCGHSQLERREITVDDSELSAPGYRDLLTPQYVIAVVVVGLLGTVLLLGLAGVVNVPGLGANVPSVADVPGNATHLDGLLLADIERALLDRANELRSQVEQTQLDRNGQLMAVATYANQRRVKARLGEGTLPSGNELAELIEGPCDGQASLVAETIPIPADETSETAVGDRLADRAFETGRLDLPAPRGRAGLDLHALENGSVSMTLLAC